MLLQYFDVKVLSRMLDVIHPVTTSSQTHDRRVDASV